MSARCGVTYLTTYPDPTQIWRGDSLVTCERALGGIKPSAEISRGELDWARAHALLPLNRAVIDAGKAHGWTVLGSVHGIFRGHGICADPPYPAENYRGNPFPAPVSPWPTSAAVRWFRNARESSTIQGGDRADTTGTLHPNEYGHRQIADDLAKT